MKQEGVIYCAEEIRAILDPHHMILGSRDPAGRLTEHLVWMCDQIMFGRVTGRKSHRWLGYLQAALVFTDTRDLDDMKNLSISATERFPEDGS